MTLALPSGASVDFYNLHADAGSEAGDSTARVSDFKQVASYIAAHSAGKAVVVFGDTNSRYTRTADQWPSFLNNAGLTDTWVELVRGGTSPAAGADALLCAEPVPQDNSCEVVDKVL